MPNLASSAPNGARYNINGVMPSVNKMISSVKAAAMSPLLSAWRRAHVTRFIYFATYKCNLKVSCVHVAATIATADSVSARPTYHPWIR